MTVVGTRQRMASLFSLTICSAIWCRTDDLDSSVWDDHLGEALDPEAECVHTVGEAITRQVTRVPGGQSVEPANPTVVCPSAARCSLPPVTRFLGQDDVCHCAPLGLFGQ